MQRITKSMLEKRVAYLNTLVGGPETMYQSRDVVDGKPVGDLVANAGHIHLTGAYGGWQVDRMCEGGGSSHLFYAGFESKRDVWTRVDAFIDGFEYKENLAAKARRDALARV